MSPREFDTLKTGVLQCNTKQRAELQALLTGLSPKKAERDNTRADTARELYGLLCVAVSRTDGQRKLYPAFAQLRALMPTTCIRLQEVDAYLKTSLPEVFPSASHIEQRGLIPFLVLLCVNYLEDNDIPRTIDNALAALCPLPELFENRYPGYQSKKGLLEMVVLNYISRKGSPCLEPTRFAK